MYMYLNTKMFNSTFSLEIAYIVTDDGGLIGWKNMDIAKFEFNRFQSNTLASLSGIKYDEINFLSVQIRGQLLGILYSILRNKYKKSFFQTVLLFVSSKILTIIKISLIKPIAGLIRALNDFSLFRVNNLVRAFVIKLKFTSKQFNSKWYVKSHTCVIWEKISSFMKIFICKMYQKSNLAFFY